jgi:phosphomannomutase
VVGHDSRPSSPDLVVGAAAALRRMGCQVIDVGVTSTPCLWFAVDHLRAAGGMYVTGNGSGPASAGLEFIESPSVPWSRGGTLDRLQERFEDDVTRPTRSGGTQRVFRAVVPYAAGLWKHFHALRPLRIGLVCTAPVIGPLLMELFAQLPCTLKWMTMPVADDQHRAEQLAAERMAASIRDQGLHAGVLIGEDAQRCRAFDERGRELDVGDLCCSFARLAREESDAPVVVLDESLAPGAQDRLHRLNCRAVPVQPTREAISRRLLASQALLAAQADGRFWFRDAHPECDAVITLAKLLQVLSRSDAAASELHSA